jgi:hypothetical protein
MGPDLAYRGLTREEFSKGMNMWITSRIPEDLSLKLHVLSAF